MFDSEIQKSSTDFLERLLNTLSNFNGVEAMDLKIRIAKELRFRNKDKYQNLPKLQQIQKMRRKENG